KLEPPSWRLFFHPNAFLMPDCQTPGISGCRSRAERNTAMADNVSHAAFVQRAWDDTYALLISMRNYVSGPSTVDARMLDPEDRLRLTSELSRVTRLLTEVMAWLMVQKAVALG